MFSRFFAISIAALLLSGCAGLTRLEQVYAVATTATVPADVVRPAANTFDILKGSAVNFARYCIAQKFQAVGCDIDTRRRIVTFVKQGTNARRVMRSALATGEPVSSTIYNLLIGAVNGLKSTPVSTFGG